MQSYPIPMVPGPVVVPDAIRQVYMEPYGSGDLEADFVELYTRTQRRLKAVLGTRDDIVIQSGEGMLALWSALKSCLVPGDRVLAVATGVFGPLVPYDPEHYFVLENYLDSGFSLLPVLLT